MRSTGRFQTQAQSFSKNAAFVPVETLSSLPLIQIQTTLKVLSKFHFAKSFANIYWAPISACRRRKDSTKAMPLRSLSQRSARGDKQRRTWPRELNAPPGVDHAHFRASLKGSAGQHSHGGPQMPGSRTQENTRRGCRVSQAKRGERDQEDTRQVQRQAGLKGVWCAESQLAGGQM